MQRIIILSLIFLITTILHTYAQLTLEGYREQVVAYSWALKNAQNTTTQSEQSVVYTKTLLLPELLATGSYRYFLRQFDGQKPWSVAFEPQVVQTIYGGGVIKAEVEKAKLTNRVAICSENFTLLEVNYAADYAYWNYWAMNRYYQVMAQYVAIIEKQRMSIQHRFDEGYTPKGDLLMMESQLNEAKYELIESNQTRLKALYNLNILRGVNPADSVQMERFSIEGYDNYTKLSFEEILDLRPDYQAILLKEQIARIETKGVRGGYNPTLAGGIAGGVRTYLPNLDGDTYLDGSVWLTLSIPIYRFQERGKAVAVAKSNERQSQINSAILLDAIKQEQSNGWMDVEENRKQLEITEQALGIASENLEISTYSYNEGLVSIIELMQAQISWMQIYTNAIDSQYSYMVSLAYYKKISGVVE